MIDKCKPCFRIAVCLMTAFSAENFCFGPFNDENDRVHKTYQEPRRKTAYFDWGQLEKDTEKLRGLKWGRK